MAAKKKRTKSEPTPRNLLKIIPSLGTTSTDAGSQWEDSEYTEVNVGGAHFPCFVWSGYWDMSGFTVQDKTWISLGAGIQDPGLYTLTPGPVPPSDSGLVSLELMTTTPLDIQTVADDLAANRMPTFLATTANWEQVIFAQWRGWAGSTTASFPDVLTPFMGQEFGSGEPSAAEKIYLYRFLLPSGTAAPTTTFRVPGLRFLLGGVPVAEPDLEWIYRLRRSYITQGELK